jgi:hypothetical protein
MELRPQEDESEEQCHKTDTLCLAMHVLSKTKLRMDWLQRQAVARSWFLFSNVWELLQQLAIEFASSASFRINYLGIAHFAKPLF